MYFIKYLKVQFLVIKESKTKKAFAIEEIIGTSLLIAIAVSAFKDLTIFGLFNKKYFKCFNSINIRLAKWYFSWCNIWSNNRCCNCNNSKWWSNTIAAFAISGMIAGLLNKIGKIGVILGFILGQ